VLLGTIFAAISATAPAVQYFWPRASRRLGLTSCMALGLGMGGLCVSLMIMASEFWQLLVLAITSSAFFNSFLALWPLLLSEKLEREELKLALGGFYAIADIGLIVGGIFGSLILAVANAGVAVFADGALAMFGALVLLWRGEFASKSVASSECPERGCSR